VRAGFTCPKSEHAPNVIMAQCLECFHIDLSTMSTSGRMNSPGWTMHLISSNFGIREPHTVHRRLL
jgi:hypothetical protein